MLDPPWEWAFRTRGPISALKKQTKPKTHLTVFSGALLFKETWWISPFRGDEKKKKGRPGWSHFRKPVHIPRGSHRGRCCEESDRQPDPWSQPRIDCLCFSSCVRERNAATPLLCRQQAAYSCGPWGALNIASHCLLPLCYQLITWPHHGVQAASHQKLDSAFHRELATVPMWSLT